MSAHSSSNEYSTVPEPRPAPADSGEGADSVLRERLFRSGEVDAYDFSGAPTIVRLRSDPLQDSSDAALYSQWSDLQTKLMRWTADGGVFHPEEVAASKSAFESFFADRGPLSGTVLDIGGGWGLFREWWQPAESDFFLVHDPGVERFLRGPHPAHRQHYRRAFEHPMVFVEGYGEDLPYRNESFDTCLLASALDHCLDAGRVISEAYRSLRAGGTFLLVQHCEGSTGLGPTDHKHRFRRRLRTMSRLIRRPRQLGSVVYYRFFYSDPHMSHFTVPDVLGAIKAAGFSDVNVRPIPELHGVYAFEATKG